MWNIKSFSKNNDEHSLEYISEEDGKSANVEEETKLKDSCDFLPNAVKNNPVNIKEESRKANFIEIIDCDHNNIKEEDISDNENIYDSEVYDIIDIKMEKIWCLNFY